MVKQFVIGTIAGTHGVKGDVKVFAECDDPERFRVLKTVYIKSRGKVTKTTASNCRFAGKFVVIHLSGIEDMDAARLLHGAELLVDREDAPKLPEGRYYIPDLIGIDVLDEDVCAFLGDAVIRRAACGFLAHLCGRGNEGSHGLRGNLVQYDGMVLLRYGSIRAGGDVLDESPGATAHDEDNKAFIPRCRRQDFRG